MTLKLTKCVAALALAGLVAPAFADDAANNLEFHGYFRGATGVNTRGGALACFHNGATAGNGGTASWRLGNECDYVIEPNFIYTVAKTADMGVWKVQFMPSIYRAYDIPSWNQEYAKPNGSVNTDLTVRYNQVFIRGENIPQLGNGTLWGGRRFYDRVQLGINDEFLENHDGEGAGLEDIDVGIGKLSYGFLTASTLGGGTEANRAPIDHAFRLTGIKTLPKSSLDIYAGYATASVSDGAEKGDATTRLGAYHKTADTILGGETFLGVKLTHSGDRQTQKFVWQQGGNIGETALSLIAEVNRVKNNDAVNKDFGLGVRSDTHISGPFRFLAEVGGNRVKLDNGDTQNFTKLTLAGAVSAGTSDGSRPTFRLYYTYGRWSDNQNAASGAGGAVFADRTSGSSIGAQVEAWW